MSNLGKLEGNRIIRSILDAGSLRVRPIIIATVAVIVGMLPVALAKGAGAEWKNGLAWVLIGGLLSSMFLTIILVPVLYYIVDAVKFRIAKRRS